MNFSFTKSLFIVAVLLSINTYAQEGSLDLPFPAGYGPDDSGLVFTTAIQSDGKIIVGGGFSDYNGIYRNCIARLHTDGSLDTTFNYVGSEFFNYVTSVAIQSDGKIIVGGKLSVNGDSRCVMRLNKDGSEDISFNRSQIIGVVYSISIQSDSKIIVGGAILSSNLAPPFGIVRLNTDGSLDTGFMVGTGLGESYNSVRTTCIQSDGKIIIGGWFPSYNGIPRNSLARLNTDGSLDVSFKDQLSVTGGFFSLAIQSDGKILIGGFFSAYSGIARYGIARLNIDGSLDPSFDTGTESSNDVLTILIQCDGKIIIGGEFKAYNYTRMNYIVRLNPNGSLDTSFNSGGTGANNYVLTMAMQNDGKIIFGGHFTSYNGTNKNRMARLIDSPLHHNYQLIYSDTCFSDQTQFSISDLYAYDSLRWNFNDPASNSFNNSTLGTPVHQFTSTGSYKVSAIVYSCHSPDTISKQLFITPKPQISLGNDTILCAGDSLKLSTNLNLSQYLWSNNSQNNNILVKKGGKYWVRVTEKGCANSDTINIDYYSAIQLGRDTVLCTDSSYTLDPHIPGSSVYLWSDGSSTSSVTIKNSGTYWVRASNGHCTSSDTISLIFDSNANKNMLIAASKDTVSYKEGIQFTAIGSNILNFKWNFSDGSSSLIQNPYHVFTESGDYNVIVEGTNVNHCTVIRNLQIVVKEVLYFPNLFSPNKDDLNDEFQIIYNGREKYQLDVYNLWGAQVFTSNEKTNLWDGNNASEGVYYYSLAIGSKVYKGWVQLIK